VPTVSPGQITAGAQAAAAAERSSRRGTRDGHGTDIQARHQRRARLASADDLRRSGPRERSGHQLQLRIASIDHVEVRRSAIVAVDDPYLAAKHADATEWPQLRELNWTAVAEHAPRVVVVDTRNPLDPAVVSDARFTYLGNGTPSGF
jgi:hypothetical protein